MSDEQILDLRRAELVLVGCGGVMFHALSQIGATLNTVPRLEIVGIQPVDPDYIEQSNLGRQPWGRPGESKAFLAADWWERLWEAANANRGVDVRIRPLVRNIQEWEEADKEGYQRLRRGGIVICAPDNHEARVATIEAVEKLDDVEQPVVLVIAGNEWTYGSAMGTYWEAGAWAADLREAHPELMVEDDLSTHRLGCDQTPEQSAEGNGLTGLCVARVLRDLLTKSTSYSEHGWTASEKQTVLFETIRSERQGV